MGGDDTGLKQALEGAWRSRSLVGEGLRRAPRRIVCLRCVRFEDCEGYLATGQICTPVEVTDIPPALVDVAQRMVESRA
jgi:hypothetical protein